MNDVEEIKAWWGVPKIMDAGEAEPLHFIIPSTEFIIFSCWDSGRCTPCADLIATCKKLEILFTNFMDSAFIITCWV